MSSIYWLVATRDVYLCHHVHATRGKAAAISARERLDGVSGPTSPALARLRRRHHLRRSRLDGVGFLMVRFFCLAYYLTFSYMKKSGISAAAISAASDVSFLETPDVAQTVTLKSSLTEMKFARMAIDNPEVQHELDARAEAAALSRMRGSPEVVAATRHFGALQLLAQVRNAQVLPGVADVHTSYPSVYISDKSPRETKFVNDSVNFYMEGRLTRLSITHSRGMKNFFVKVASGWEYTDQLTGEERVFWSWKADEGVIDYGQQTVDQILALLSVPREVFELFLAQVAE